MKMKILLVGGLGFIGKRFIQKFSNNYDLVIYAKKDSVFTSKNDDLPCNISIEEGSIEEETIFKIIKKHRPDIVILFAALTGLTRCEERPDETFRVNVFGTYNIIKSCLEIGAKLVFASSFEVYGQTQKYEREENDILNPINTYAITKMLGEDLIKHANRMYGLKYTILRISNVYGPGYNLGINAMIKSAIMEKRIRVNGKNRFKNFLFIDDAIELINSVINDNRCLNEIVNIGSNDTVTLTEVAKKISCLLRSDIKIECLPEIDLETDYRPSLKKLKSLGFMARTTLEQGLESTIKWYRNTNHEN